MRHKKESVKLGRLAGPRKAVMRSLAIALIENGRITTTAVKARALKKFIEPLVTKGGSKSVHTIREIEKKLSNKKAALKLVNEIGPKFKSVNGGYTRITKLIVRKGDGAEQSVIEWVTK
ncbi:MAG: 50S ribosomal protein L17 [Candidatus Kerfeldbacteria bacterium]